MADVEKNKDSKEHQSVKDASQKESADQVKISGSCACGATKWTSTHLPNRGSFCYCTTCRKISGGAFIAFMDFPGTAITFSPAESSSSSSSSSSTLKLMAISENAERGFCWACGSTLTIRYRATPETLYLTIASVNGGVESALEGLSRKHIYVGDKVDWYKLPDDGLPRFETMPNETKYLIYGD